MNDLDRDYSDIDNSDGAIEDIDIDISDPSSLDEDEHIKKPTRISGGFRFQPLKNDWTQMYGEKFTGGQKVLYKGKKDVKDVDEDDLEVYCVTGPGYYPDTYRVLSYGSRDPVEVNGSCLMEASPEKAKTWKSYREVHDICNIPGLKVSCPSNEKFKKLK